MPLRLPTLRSFLALAIMGMVAPTLAAQKLDPSRDIVSATATVLMEDDEVVHFEVSAELLPKLLKSVFPASRVSVDKPSSPLGAIQFFDAKGEMTRVRFYASPKNAFVFDVTGDVYQCSSDVSGQSLQEQLRNVHAGNQPSPDRPVFLHVLDQVIHQPPRLGSYLFAIHATDPKGEKLQYSFGTAKGPSAMPKGALSIDSSSGEIYIMNMERFPAEPGEYKVTVVVRNESGLESSVTFAVASAGTR